MGTQTCALPARVTGRFDDRVGFVVAGPAPGDAAQSGDRFAGSGLREIGLGTAGGPVAVRTRTAAGAAATRRRQRRIARRRPASGLLPSTAARRPVVTCGPEAVRTVVRGYVMSRAARLAMTLTVAVSAVMIGMAVLAAPAAGGLTQVTVAPGDSLWSIAQASDPGRDPRDVVEDIRRLNALTDGVLPIGVMLTVPVAEG